MEPLDKNKIPVLILALLAIFVFMIFKFYGISKEVVILKNQGNGIVNEKTNQNNGSAEEVAKRINQYGASVMLVGGTGSRMIQKEAYSLEDQEYLTPEDEWVSALLNGPADFLRVACRDGFELSACEGGTEEKDGDSSFCTRAVDKEVQNAVNIECMKSGLDSATEVIFSEAELKAYYASYGDPFVVHLRKALNGYLVGTNDGMSLPEVVIEKRTDEGSVYGLSSFDKSYYQSKFAIWRIDEALGGGKDITLIFQDKPDKIFHAWIYELGNGEGYDLREFREDTEDSKDIGALLKAYGKYILDKNHSL